ncbi:MAG: hypothetical protein Tsb0014_33790 [Pleurocapsa sp.]
MKTFFTAVLFSLGLIGGATNIVYAESPNTAPKELTETISKLEKAANDRDLEQVMKYYGSNFTNNDGLTRSSVSSALAQMWKAYPRVRYTTELDSWEQDGEQLIAETTTNVRGVKKEQERVIRFNSVLRSRQYFEKGKLVRQDILSEQTKLTSGDNPPKVQVSVPETVELGEKYNFDVVVTEPLDDRVLLGAVKEERVGSDLYLNPTALELEQLPAGGIYTKVTAPLLADRNWLSAILVRGDGIVMVTHRVTIQGDK